MADSAAAGDVPPPPPAEQPTGEAAPPEPQHTAADRGAEGPAAAPQPASEPAPAAEANDGAAAPAAAEPPAAAAAEPAGEQPAQPPPAAAEAAKDEPAEPAAAPQAPAAAEAQEQAEPAAEGAGAAEQGEGAGAAAGGAGEAAQAAAAKEPPTDEALLARLRELLGEVDLATTTEKQLRRRLEGECGVPLGDRKALLRAEIDAYLQAGEEGEEGMEEEEAEEEEQGSGGGGGARKRRAAGSSLGSYLSPEMQAFLGEERMPRTQVVKRMWEYIKGHNLQDPKNKRTIIFDDKLKALFPGTKTDMFKLQKLLSKHCKTSDVVGGSDDEEGEEEEEEFEEGEGEEEEEGGSGEGSAAPAAKRARRASGAAAKASGSAGGSASRRKSRARSSEGGEKRAPNPNNAFTKQLQLSEDMAAWIGKPTASRPEMTKFFWAYVKDKGLQDPSDKGFILSDEPLKRLTGEERFKAFGHSKYFKKHIVG